MKPPERGWVIFVLLIAWSVWMVACGQTMGHRNFRLGHGAGLRVCTDQTMALAKYVQAYSQGDSIAVPIDLDGDGIFEFLWTDRNAGYGRWVDDIRKVELP